jgi:hypothetical protein
VGKSMKYSSFLHFIFRLSLINFVGFFILFVLRRFEVYNNLLFEQILFSDLATGLLFSSYFLYKKAKDDRIFLQILIACLLMVSVANFTLVNIDRSRSFYLLSWVEKSKIVLTDLEIDLSQVESPEKFNSDAIRLRLKEQTSRGLVYIDKSEYKLTSLGKSYLLSAQWFAKIYKLENWYRNQS